jgi:hypothetical protein
MTRRKRPWTFVPGVLFLSTGVVVSIGSVFYPDTPPSPPPTAHAAATRPLETGRALGVRFEQPVAGDSCSAAGSRCSARCAGMKLGVGNT